MDVFIERLIRKKTTAKDIFLKIAVVVLAFVISITAALFLMGGAFTFLIPFIFIGAGYGSWWYITSLNIEYEYAFTSGDLDVDKIIAKRNRTHVLTVDCKKFTVLAPVNEKYMGQFNDTSVRTRIDASSGSGSGAYFAVYDGENGCRTRLVFEPDQDMLDAMKKYIPNKIMS